MERNGNNLWNFTKKYVTTDVKYRKQEAKYYILNLNLDKCNMSK